MNDSSLCFLYNFITNKKEVTIMNFAAKEFIETGIDWASAALSRLAKEHGGPKQLIADIYENGYLDGYNDALKDEKMKRFGIVGISLTGVLAASG